MENKYFFFNNKLGEVVTDMSEGVKEKLFPYSQQVSNPNDKMKQVEDLFNRYGKEFQSSKMDQRSNKQQPTQSNFDYSNNRSGVNYPSLNNSFTTKQGGKYNNDQQFQEYQKFIQQQQMQMQQQQQQMQQQQMQMQQQPVDKNTPPFGMDPNTVLVYNERDGTYLTVPYDEMVKRTRNLSVEGNSTNNIGGYLWDSEKSKYVRGGSENRNAYGLIEPEERYLRRSKKSKNKDAAQYVYGYNPQIITAVWKGSLNDFSTNKSKLTFNWDDSHLRREYAHMKCNVEGIEPNDDNIFKIMTESKMVLKNPTVVSAYSEEAPVDLHIDADFLTPEQHMGDKMVSIPVTNGSNGQMYTLNNIANSQWVKENYDGKILQLKNITYENATNGKGILSTGSSLSKTSEIFEDDTNKFIHTSTDMYKAVKSGVLVKPEKMDVNQQGYWSTTKESFDNILGHMMETKDLITNCDKLKFNLCRLNDDFDDKDELKYCKGTRNSGDGSVNNEMIDHYWNQPFKVYLKFASDIKYI